LAVAVQSKRDISRVEDYLEAIYNLNEEKGFISASDISERLGVKSPTVSAMVSKLAKEGYLERERYRGMKLTDRGIRVARSVIRRHETIFELLTMFGLSKDVAYVDTEGIEHHLHPATIQKFERLVEFLKTNPEISAKLKQSMDRE
jgi:Mn-dependent DtxR family transcriptional regulator